MPYVQAVIHEGQRVADIERVNVITNRIESKNKDRKIILLPNQIICKHVFLQLCKLENKNRIILNKLFLNKKVQLPSTWQHLLFSNYIIKNSPHCDIHMPTELNNVKTNFNNIHKSDFIRYITAYVMMNGKCT